MAKKWLSPFALGERDIENKPQTNFDTDYKSIEIRQRVKKTGEGSPVFINWLIML